MPYVPTSTAQKFIAWAVDYGYMAAGHAQILRVPFVQTKLINPGKPTMLIIPGIFESRYFTLSLALKLAKTGYDIRLLPVRFGSYRSLDQNARLIDSYIQAYELEHVTLIGHSKGGLDGLVYLDRIDQSKVARLITVATPFNGTALARYLPLPFMRPFLPNGEYANIIANIDLQGMHVTSISPSWDNHVFHSDKSALKGAQNIELPVYGHHRILFSQQLADEIAGLIAS